jgi:deoxypyrimidine-specific 5' nucleotidase type C protein (NT5C)
VTLRIAFDLDGVLADMDAELLRQSRILFGEHAVPSAPAQTESETATESALPASRIQLSARQVSRVWRHVVKIENFWESLDEIEPGVIARLSALASERRWEIIFLTKRPETAGATAQMQSQRWLESKGFTLPSVFVVRGSRSRVAASLGLDFVIDDLPKTCVDVSADSKARAILVWRDDESLLPAAVKRLGIGVVKSVGECLDVLTEVDASSHERTGVVDRVMRLLGLKNEPARA